MTRTYNIDKDDPVTIIEQLEEEIEQQAEQIRTKTQEINRLVNEVELLQKDNSAQAEQIQTEKDDNVQRQLKSADERTALRKTIKEQAEQIDEQAEQIRELQSRLDFLEDMEHIDDDDFINHKD